MNQQLFILVMTLLSLGIGIMCFYLMKMHNNDLKNYNNERTNRNSK